jgi:adenylate cyclase
MNRPRIGRLQRSLFLAIGVILTGVVLVLYAVDGLKDLELETVDTRFQVRGERSPEDLVVVGVDDVTFDELRVRWPFRRTLHARAVRNIVADGPRAIGYDVQFTEPSEIIEDDLALAEAIEDSQGKVVLGTSEVDDRGRTNILGGDDVVRDIGARPANANIPPDPGSVLRRFRYEVDKLKTLAVATAEVATGKKVSRDSFHDEGAAWIDFAGGPGKVPSVSFSRAVRGKFPKGTFKDKVVVIGTTAPSLQDVHPTSTTRDEVMAGPEIQANAIDTVRRGFPLESVPGPLNVALIVLLGMVAPLASLRLSAVRTTVLAVGLGLAYVLVAFLLFNAGWVVSLVYPVGALLLTSFGSLLFHYVTTAFERERTRDLFARFVPENVVDEVIDSTEDLRLGGEERELTLMFTDVRGFTTFSESRPPVQVIEILNRYLSGMSDAILDHGGTLSAFLGDGIMAVFGAPVQQEDHADRALAAALELLRHRLPEFNEWMRSEGYGDGFYMGVGLNSGTGLAGNVGSERRLEYTVIGDTVNTASRIEGITKDTPYQLLLADSTRQLLTKETDKLIDLGEFDVRGRAAKTRLWTHSDESVKKKDWAPKGAASPKGGEAPKDDAQPALSD